MKEEDELKQEMFQVDILEFFTVDSLLCFPLRFKNKLYYINEGKAKAEKS